jgi:hypothetical protein
MEHETNVGYCESRTLKTNSSTFPKGGSAVKAKIHTTMWKKSAIDTRMVSVTQKNIIPNLVLKEQWMSNPIDGNLLIWRFPNLWSPYKYLKIYEQSNVLGTLTLTWFSSIIYNKGHAEYALGNAGMQFRPLKISSRNLYTSFFLSSWS